MLYNKGKYAVSYAGAGRYILEFNEKLQELRKRKGLTQEELAEVFYVSRTAISKWESGRGYPGIDSLKRISEYFSVSLDELLSSEELLTAAQEEGRKKEQHFRDLVFGLLDVSIMMFLFLPFYGQRVDGVIREVSLLGLTEVEIYIKIPYLIMVFALVIWGLLMLALQNCAGAFWMHNKYKGSLGISSFAVLMFVASRQPYAAAFSFLFLSIKALLLIKWE